MILYVNSKMKISYHRKSERYISISILPLAIGAASFDVAAVDACCCLNCSISLRESDLPVPSYLSVNHDDIVLTRLV